MYSYQGLWETLKNSGLKKFNLVKKVGFSTRTIAKISRGENIADNVIKKLCKFFGCTKEALQTEVCDSAVLQILHEEKTQR